jgi:hypothetical protein
MTFRRSLRMIAKRWWLLLLGGVVVAALAFLVVGQKKPHYVIASVLSVNDVTVQPKYGHPGFDVLPSQQKFPDSWVTQDFLSQKAAQAASQEVGGHPSPGNILSNLFVTGLTGTTVSLQYTGGSNSDGVTALLKRYVSTLLLERTQREQNSVHQALLALQQVTPQTPKIQKNEQTLAFQLQQLPGNFSSDFESVHPPQPQKVSAGGPPLPIIILGGFLAGVAAGALIALLLGRFDKRVRRPDDIEVSGVPVVDIDSDLDPASVQLLRSELELAGMGTRLGVIAVTRATRDEGSSGLALALARTFASVGTPTVLVSADLRARKMRGEAGLSGLLDGSLNTLPLMPLESNLAWLPEGSSTALPETLFSAPRVERIIRDLRDQAGVVVIDTPAVLEDSEALPLLASSDLVLLAVRPGRTRWNPLGSAVALIQRVAKRPLHICYDRAEEASSVPAAGVKRSDLSERVHQAIEVPASS